MNAFEDQLEKFFRENLPRLSANAKESLVKFYPWVLIVLGGLGLLAWFGTIGLFSFGMMAAGVGHMPGFQLSIFTMLLLYLLTPITCVLPIVAGYFMLSRQMKGWRIAFYSLLISFVLHIFSLSILGLILDVLFAYLLFQIKESYS